MNSVRHLLRSLAMGAALAVCIALPAAGQDQSEAATAVSLSASDEAAARKSLRNICLAVHSRTETTPEAGPYRYLAIQKLADAAGVAGRVDSEQEVQQLQATWARFRGLLVCNSLQFDVQNGSILKYAVATTFDEFVRFAADNKLGLTQVDESDGRTVLDYVADHRKRAAPALAHTYELYYQLLRKAGGKHAGELR